jgi:MFS family permease
MSFDEKNTWAFGLIAIAGYVTYLVVILTQGTTPLTGSAYIAPMLSTIGVAIAAGIVAGIVLGMVSTRDRTKKDERDRQIYRRGEYAGHAMVLAGAIGALILALVEAEHFWIANTIYLAFVLGAVLSSIVKIVAYRRGFAQW